MWSLLVDNREIASDVPRLLTNMGVSIQYKQLEVGDYILSATVAIERKSIQDFITSLYDGRLFKQAKAIQEAYAKPLLLIEGDIAMIGNLVTNSNVYYGALAALAINSNLKTVFVPSAEHTAIFIERTIKSLLKNKDEQAPIAYKHTKGYDVEIQQIYFLASLPGIGNKLAERLLSRFNSLGLVLNASKEELSDVIGPKRASNIKKFLNVKFKYPTTRINSQPKLDDIL
ncbi:MAG: heavy metal resistance protein CzcA [Nitrososphaerota archaeon]|nr:heavy metal resistance protein CzcA [Nitrososphaerota archaeon]